MQNQASFNEQRFQVTSNEMSFTLGWLQINGIWMKNTNLKFIVFIKCIFLF